jgi:hypothetical protein
LGVSEEEGAYVQPPSERKPGFYQRAAYWRDDPVLQILVFNAQNSDDSRRGRSSLSKWNWPADSQLTVCAAANCDEVELFLNDRSLGRHVISRDVYASDWSVACAPGVLSAIGYRAGQQVAARTLATTGAAARLAIAIHTDAPLGYSITVDDKPVLVRSRLWLELADKASLGEHPVLEGEERKSSDVHWENPFGKNRDVRDHYNELCLTLKESDRTSGVAARAYDDGVAFRLAPPGRPGMDSFVVTRDVTEFKMAFTPSNSSFRLPPTWAGGINCRRSGTNRSCRSWWLSARNLECASGCGSISMTLSTAPFIKETFRCMRNAALRD